MKRRPAVSTAILCATILTAASAHAQAAAPFPVVESAPAAHQSHRLANASVLGGIALIAASFAIEHQADRAYDDYLAAIEPSQISRLYQRTVRFDHESTAALIGGNVLVAAGLYLRFVRPSPSTHLSLAVDARRCAVNLSF
jgi:hypothetical protein